MSSYATKLKQCPDHVELSLYCDDCQTDPAIIAHIEECSKCLEVVAQYREIGDAIAGSNDDLPDMAIINEHIRARIRVEKARAPRFNFLFINNLTKVAAILVVSVVTGVAGITIGRQIWTGEGEVPTTGIVDNDPVPEDSKIPDLPYYTGFDFNLRHANSIPIQNMAAANYGDKAPVFSAVKDLAQPVIHAQIDTQVHQVWNSANGREFVPALQNYLRRHPDISARIGQSPRGTTVLQATLTKMQLVNLVRFLDSQKLDLLSPMSPQPEQNYFLGSPDDQVTYSAEFATN